MKTLDQRDQEYQQFVADEQRRATMTLVVLGICLFPIFSLLDFFTQREHLEILSLIRYSAVALFLVVFILLKKGFLTSSPFLTGAFLLLTGATSISLMCASLTGSGSSYYGGVNLVLLAGVLILPGQGLQTSIWIVLSLLIYVMTILISEDFSLLHPEIFINNMFFMSSTAVIGITSGILRSKLRKNSYHQFLEIKGTANLLSQDLQSKDSNIESLAEEIVQKKIEAQNALELRNSFISIASHELKTPLTALKLQVDAGKVKEFYGELVWKTFIHSIDQQILRLIRMVDEMLDVSRIQTGKFSLQVEKMDLCNLIKDIKERYYEQSIKDGKLILEVEAELHGEWDSFKLEQVLLNLLSNAFRYGRSRPVYLSAQKGTQSIIITVRDHGLGIAEEDRSRIFEKFERGPTNDISGLGLGLFICKEIVEGHKGQIFLESEVGNGSVFKVVLPTNHH